MNDQHRKQIAFEKNEKSKGIAYILWLLFGWLGVHRFYAGKTGTGLAQLMLTLSMVGLVVTIFWWLIDAFLIPDMINEHNLNTIDMIYGNEPETQLVGAEPQALTGEMDERRQAMLDDLKQTGYRKQRRDTLPHLYR